MNETKYGLTTSQRVYGTVMENREGNGPCYLMISRRLNIKKIRQEQIKIAVLKIEEFIADIPDSNARQIFEMTYIEGKKQREIADDLGYSRGRIPQIISQYLKD